MRTAALALVLLLAGCRTAATVPENAKGEEIYQTIANQLPKADLGFGDPPAIARMAASERGREDPDPSRLQPSCNERSFTIVVEVHRPRLFTVPYSALEGASYAWNAFPNLLFCFVFPFFQTTEATVVFDARKVPGLLDHIRGECDRLEDIAREVGFGGPYDHAMFVRRKLLDDAREFGEGRLSLTFGYAAPVPPFIPFTGRARSTAEAFEWARAHPSEPAK